MTRAAALASWGPRSPWRRRGPSGTRGVRLEDVEDVLGQGELDVHQPADPDALGELAGRPRTRASSNAPRVAGGRVHAESPEWMPASSMCSMIPPT